MNVGLDGPMLLGGQYKCQLAPTLKMKIFAIYATNSLTLDHAILPMVGQEVAGREYHSLSAFKNPF